MIHSDNPYKRSLENSDSERENKRLRVEQKSLHIFELPEDIFQYIVNGFLLDGINIYNVQKISPFTALACTSHTLNKLAQKTDLLLLKQSNMKFETSSEAIEYIMQAKSLVANFRNVKQVEKGSIEKVLRECTTVRHLIYEPFPPFSMTACRNEFDTELTSYLCLAGNRLQTLILHEIEVMPEFPTGMHALRSLIVRNCKNLKVLPEDLTSLTLLDVNAAYRLNKLPNGLSKVWSLKLRHCFDLKELPADMTKLERLGVTVCRELMLPNNLPSLKSLELYNYKHVELLTFTSLTCLSLTCCNFTSLSNSLCSLRFLTIVNENFEFKMPTILPFISKLTINGKNSISVYEGPTMHVKNNPDRLCDYQKK